MHAAQLTTITVYITFGPQNGIASYAYEVDGLYNLQTKVQWNLSNMDINGAKID